MKPADMKLSMASAGTLLSFTSHWSSGTYSTWSSTNWTHEHITLCYFTVKHSNSCTQKTLCNDALIPSTYLAAGRSSALSISHRLTRQLHYQPGSEGRAPSGSLCRTPCFSAPWSNNLLYNQTQSSRPVEFCFMRVPAVVAPVLMMTTAAGNKKQLLPISGHQSRHKFSFYTRSFMHWTEGG